MPSARERRVLLRVRDFVDTMSFHEKQHDETTEMVLRGVASGPGYRAIRVCLRISQPHELRNIGNKTLTDVQRMSEPLLTARDASYLGESFADVSFNAALRRAIVNSLSQLIGKILLRHHAHGVIVRIDVTFAMTKALGSCI